MSSATSGTATPRDGKSKSTSPSTPIDSDFIPDEDETKIEDIHDNDISSTIKEEEARFQAESKKAQEDDDRQRQNVLKQEGVDFKKLQFLIKQSTVYSSIISEMVEKERKSKAEKDAKADEKKPVVDAKELAKQATKKTTRSGATAEPVKKSEEKATDRRKSGRGKAAAPPPSTKRETSGSILTFFSKGKPDEAGSEKEELVAAVEKNDVDASGTKATVPAQARQPKLVTGCTMKDYQLEGLEWMATLFENGLNGILADEMGLGKTLQTISLFAFLRENGVYGPFLVATPLSTLANWVDEFAKFTPDIPVVLYHGSPQERERIRNKQLKKVDANFPVVCTSYEIIMNDRKFLERYHWKYIVVDEGHRLKNFNCRLIRELKKYDSANRLLLTGTPLQNNLSELWSLLNFILPDIFNDIESFQNWFDFTDLQSKGGHDKIVQQELGTNLVSSLHAILKPFLLRRLKTDVEVSLPKKREYILYAPLSQTQKELYRKILDHDTEDYLVGKLLSSRKKPAKSIPKSTPKKKGRIFGSDTPSKRKATDDLEDVQEQLNATSNLLTVPGVSPAKSLRASRSNKKLRVDYKETSDREYFKKIENEVEPELESTSEPDEEDLALQQALKEVRSKKMQNPVMQLRLACNSPHLFYWPWGDKAPDETLVTESGKMMLLDRLIPALFKENHKVLIFSQFKVQLDILEEWATQLRGWRTCRIDGEVKQEDRRELIKSFNTSNEYKLFLLSTRAGGLGINLTAADTVILYDSDWNPQQDLQAQDRAHRIGQTRPVIVYRLATAATVEQTLLEKADSKRRLEKLVIQKGKFKSMRQTSKDQEDEEFSDLKSILMSDDFEKFETASTGKEILSDEDLEVLLDRSEVAYEKAAKGETKNSSVFKAVETKKVSEGDILAEM